MSISGSDKINIIVWRIDQF